MQLPNGNRAELPSYFADANDSYLFRVEDRFVVGALVHDPDSSHCNPAENDDGFGTFTEFRSAGERDDYLAQVQHEDKLAFIVDRYEHGRVHYSVNETANYPDRRWDVAPAGVFVPCDYVQEEFAKRRAELEPEKGRHTAVAYGLAAKEFVKDANATLDEYSNWRNGEVYGVLVYEFDADGKEVSPPEECWGFIGHEYARDELMGNLQRATAPQADMQVGFIGCREENVAMLAPLGFRVGRYDAERGGVMAAIAQEAFAQATPQLEDLAADFALTLHAYGRLDRDVVSYRGRDDDEAREGLAERYAAQKAWAVLHLSLPELDGDTDSTAFWRDRITDMDKRVAELQAAPKAAVPDASPAPGL
ncbi:hypothetical protein [Cupriavidus sp. TMH.W2]|uniref:hypothetical protein n=1 Tax=Cupriavidus sp. TMH.W2 TaxID=3434465 RepID=UPI003D76BAC2